MRALSFIEFVNLDNGTAECSPELKASYMVGVGLIPRNMVKGLSELSLIFLYKDHVNQPFTPELITKYFKGWEELSNGYYVAKYELKNYDVTLNRRDKSCCYEKGLDTYWFKFPRTLDDFITDCQRAGIELEWRDV